MAKTMEATRVTTEIIEIKPCIKCGSEDISFSGVWTTIGIPVKNPKAICSNCGYTPEVGPRIFNDPYEHLQFWNEMNDPKNIVELLVANINKLRAEAEDLEWELARLEVQFPEILNEEYSFGRLVSGKEAIENHKKIKTMKHIFYMMAFLPLISSMYIVRLPRRSWNELQDYKSRKKKGKEYLTAYDRGQETGIVLIFFWLFVGMFTFQGPVFFVLLLLTLFAQIGLKTRFVCAVLTVLLIAFAIFNSYYLKINVFELIGLHHG